jgi:SAM-dependent methyltransferase
VILAGFTAQELADTVAWQRAEFGSYVADLDLWHELADAGGSVLELGAGAGRVTLDLARRGHSLFAVERDPSLVFYLRRRKAAEQLSVLILRGDVGELRELWPHPASGPSSVAAPLHLIQQIDPERRPTLLSTLAELCPTEALIGLTLVDEHSLFEGGIEGGSVPDMVELDGWVYSSEPLWVQVSEETITVRRLRQRVSPGGEIERSVHDDVLHRLDPATLEAEADVAGLISREHRPIRSGPAEADSIAVILETR